MAINIPVYCSRLAPHPPPSTGTNSEKWRAKENSGNLYWFVSQIVLYFLCKTNTNWDQPKKGGVPTGVSSMWLHHWAHEYLYIIANISCS